MRLDARRARPAGEVEIFCGNAGTMLRFLVATLDGGPRPLAARRRRRGCASGRWARWSTRSAASAPASNIWAPRATCRCASHGGTLGGGTTMLDAGESSQYLSALLMAALRAPRGWCVEVRAADLARPMWT